MPRVMMRFCVRPLLMDLVGHLRAFARGPRDRAHNMWSFLTGLACLSTRPGTNVYYRRPAQTLASYPTHVPALWHQQVSISPLMF